MKKLRVISDTAIIFEGREYRSAIGKAGFASVEDKREGDLKTPTGTFALRELWYRSDKLAQPVCALPMRIITPADGWCDDPTHKDYNRAILIPPPVNGGRLGGGMFSHETLWRDDDVYDLIVPLGYNDNPPVAGRGSAIFLHVAKPDYAGTEGCVALAKVDLLEILAQVSEGDVMEIAPS